MSSYKTKARRKSTGEMHDIWCIDDYFGKRKYGYIVDKEGRESYALTEAEFNNLYEETN